MARSPAIVPLRNNDLTALNRFATAVRQRLDQIDTEFVANPVTQAQLGALQATVQRIRNDLDDLEALVNVPAAPAAASGRTFAFFAG